jgi:heme/copper-type cytochrome/quinol oxidase subunit 1
MMVEESLRAKILIGVVGPPIVTTICWWVGPLLAGARRKGTRTRNWVEFWLMLIAAYLVFTIALAGDHVFIGNDQIDPSSQLVR